MTAAVDFNQLLGNAAESPRTRRHGVALAVLVDTNGFCRFQMRSNTLKGRSVPWSVQSP
jgi:hypothetical protein